VKDAQCVDCTTPLEKDYKYILEEIYNGGSRLKNADLNKMWRTWIKIGLKSKLTLKRLQDVIRHKMYDILQLKKTGKINWYYFLYHNKPDDPTNGYFDVVFTTTSEEPTKFLPEYCVDTKKISPITEISGIDSSILKDTNIVEAWRLIGEQSQFIIDLVRTHDENSEIPPKQIARFMHYFMNALGLGHKSILFFKGIPNNINTILAFMPEENQRNCIRF